jgi:hypothetical protein
MIEHVVEQLMHLGYRALVFDLGGLGFGHALPVSSAEFHASGHYRDDDDERRPTARREMWRSTARHKPDVVARALAHVAPGELCVYLDGDAVCTKRIDEVVRHEFDLGVTSRPDWTRFADPHQLPFLGEFNAGVLFVRKSRATERLIARWQRATLRLGKDQQALHQLLNPSLEERPPGDEFAVGEVKVRVFDGAIYNHLWDQTRAALRDAKIVHYTNDSWRAELLAGRLPQAAG